jgi:hypothetical protein
MNLTYEVCNVSLVLRCFLKPLKFCILRLFLVYLTQLTQNFFPHESPYSNTLKTEIKAETSGTVKGSTKEQVMAEVIDTLFWMVLWGGFTLLVGSQGSTARPSDGSSIKMKAFGT